MNTNNETQTNLTLVALSIALMGFNASAFVFTTSQRRGTQLYSGN